MLSRCGPGIVIKLSPSSKRFRDIFKFRVDLSWAQNRHYVAFVGFVYLMGYLQKTQSLLSELRSPTDAGFMIRERARMGEWVTGKRSKYEDSLWVWPNL